MGKIDEAYLETVKIPKFRYWQMQKENTLKARKWRIFFWVAIGVFMSTLDGSIVNIALPSIMKNLKGSFAGTEWVSMIYLLTVTSLLLAFGRLSDIIGRRRVYGIGFLGFALGSMLCALADTTAELVVFRAVQGIGAAMLMACSPAIIVDAFPEAERGRALGFVGTIVALGLTTGPALGGILLEFFSWRAIFLINIPIGMAAGVAVLWQFKGSRLDIYRSEPFDWMGAVFMAVSLGLFLVAITHAYQWGVISVAFIGLVAISVGAGFIFYRIETSVRHPMISFEMFQKRLFIMPIISAVLLFMALFMIVFLMPFYLMDYLQVSEARSGYIMISLFIFLFFIPPLAGGWFDRIGSRLLCTVGMLVLTTALALMTCLPKQIDYVAVIWRLALAGIGTAIFISPNTARAMSAVVHTNRGQASGTIATARNLGMVLGIAVAGAVFNATFRAYSGGVGMAAYEPSLAPAFKAALNWAMGSGAVVAGIGAVAAYLRGPDEP